MVVGVRAVFPIEAADQQFVRSQPLAEDHRLAVRHFKDVVQEGAALVRFDAVVGLLVQQKRAVA